MQRMNHLTDVPPADTPAATAAPAAWMPRSHTELHGELHARPALPVRTPCVVSSWAQWGMNAAQAENALAELCRASGEPAPPPQARHHVLRTPRFEMRFERHGEFVSWQVNRPLHLPNGTPVDGELDALLEHAAATELLPTSFVRALAPPEGTPMIAAAHVLLLQADEDSLPRLRRRIAVALGSCSGNLCEDGAPLLGAHIADGHAVVFTDLRLRGDGFTRFVLLDMGLPTDQAAREAQRLCEIETYRMLAMLGFPVAQKEAQALGSLERTLQRTVDAMANDAAHDDAAAFETLTKLAAEIEHGAARTRYRFSATRAYHQIVQRRLADLRERRIDGVQTLSGFFGRRFAPAMALCESTDARLTDVADRINRAVNLARVRVEVQREAGNQEVFKSLARGQQLQLRLQQTVEGLSVVAISYYALGLVGYLAKAAKAVPALAAVMPPSDVVVGLAVAPVVGSVWWFLQQLHKRLGNH
jgi:uncharacterized membrane-anchored protein